MSSFACPSQWVLCPSGWGLKCPSHGEQRSIWLDPRKIRRWELGLLISGEMGAKTPWRGVLGAGIPRPPDWDRFPATVEWKGHSFAKGSGSSIA